MRTVWNRRSVTSWAAALVAMCAGTALAQDGPFTGIVDQDNVEVRAGAGRAYYLVGTLRKGQKVQVDKIIFGWPQIVAPDGTYSYVSKAFVDAKGDGKTGVVNADRTAVIAAAIGGPGDSYRRQVHLMRGDSVEIVGEEGGFYKIRPPANAFVYVAPGAVRRATAAEIDPAPPTPPSGTVTPPAPPTPPTPPANGNQTSIEEMIKAAPPTPPAQEETVTPATPPAPAAEATPPAQTPEQPQTAETTAPTTGAAKAFEIEPVSDRVKQIDAKMKATIDLPLEEQPTDELLAAYREAQRDPQLPPLDREIVKFRIATLERNKALSEGLRQLHDARAAVAASKAAEREPEEMTGPVVYAAVGQLLASSVYDGVTLPRMYRIVVPGGGRTLAYIQPSEVRNTGATLGKIVGVVGPMRFDAGLKANVIDAKRIDVLEKSAAPTSQDKAPEAPATPDADAAAAEPAAIEPALDEALDQGK